MSEGLVQEINSDETFIEKGMRKEIEHRRRKHQPPPAEFTDKDVSTVSEETCLVPHGLGRAGSVWEIQE